MVTATRTRVTTYAEAAVDGEVVVGRLVRLATERHLHDLETGADRGLVFDEDAAERAIRFFTYLRQSKGQWAGEPLTLQDWQAFVVGSIFGWKETTTGLRRFRKAYTEVARKNGKTTLAAGVALYLLDFDNEAGSEVYCAATKRDQARLCWSEAMRMVQSTPSLKRRIKIVESRANMHVLETSSKFEALGADNDSMDGLNPHAYIIDELHAHKTRGIVDALETAPGARQQPLAFYITTAGVARESVYSETHDYARRVAEGIVDDDQWFVYIATLDEGDDWTDPAVYIKANPSLGVTIQIDELTAERDRAMEAPGRQNAFRRLRLNQQTEQESRWIDIAAYDKSDGLVDVEKLKGHPCYAGLDLASRSDIAALVYVFPDDTGGFDVVARFFVPEEGVEKRSRSGGVPYGQWVREGWIEATSGNVIDYDIIRERIKEDAANYDVREIGFDRWGATQLITQLQGDGATVVPIGQGFASLSAPSKELEAFILGAKIRFGKNPVMRWMFSNVTVEMDPAGNIKPSKGKSTEKIDGVVAAIMALDRALRNNGPSVYETRGILTL